MNQVNFITTLNLNNYIFGLVFFFILLYLLSFLNFSLFLFILEPGNLNYLSSLSVFSAFKFVRIVMMLSLLNLAGVPPTPTFFVKISVISVIYKNANLIMVTAAFVLNLFAMVFYLQTIRFLTTFNSKVPVRVVGNLSYFNKSLALFLSTITLLNILLPNIMHDLLLVFENFSL